MRITRFAIAQFESIEAAALTVPIDCLLAARAYACVDQHFGCLGLSPTPKSRAAV